jgi:hypothetical protein
VELRTARKAAELGMTRRAVGRAGGGGQDGDEVTGGSVIEKES